MKFFRHFLLLCSLCAFTLAAKGKPGQSRLANPGNIKQESFEEYTSRSVAWDKKRETLEGFALSAQSSSDGLREGVATVVGGVLMHLVLGTLYCWGNFISYLPKQLKFFDGGEHSGSVTDATIIIPVMLIAQCIAMPFGPLLVGRFGSPKTMMMGSLLASSGVYLSSYATKLLPFTVLYAIIFGAGAGIAYTAPMIAGWKWLPNKKGLVSGVILTGYGVGGFLFNLLGTKLINPKGLNPDSSGTFPREVYENFSPALRKLAKIYALLSISGCILVKEPKERREGDKSIQTAGLSVREALKTRQFYTLWAMVIASASAGLNVVSVYKQFASTNSALVGDQYQAAVGALACVFNGIGRLFWGVLSDKIGFKNSFFLLTLTQAGLHGVFHRLAATKLSFMAAICSVFFLLAGNFALMPPAMVKLYGARRGTLLYGILYSAFAVASIGGMYTSKALTAKFGWSGSFQCLAAMSLLSAILTTSLTPIASLPSSAI